MLNRQRIPKTVLKVHFQAETIMFTLRHHTYLSIAAVLLLICGCQETSTSPVDDPPLVTAPAQTPAEQEADAVPEDRSLTEAAYLGAGVPDFDQRWGAAEMAQAAEVLTRISQADAGQLPRYQSPQSGALFARLTADENLAPYRDTSKPINDRMGAAIEMMQATNQVLKLYVAALYSQNVGDREIIELTGGILRISVMMTQLIDEFVPTLDPQDPTWDVRMQGLKRMKQGLSVIFLGNFKMLTEADLYRVSERKRLLGYMQQTYPVLYGALPEASRKQIFSQLETLRDDASLKELKPELTSLIQTLEKVPPQNE